MQHRPRYVPLACLIFAGEMVFSLPYHVARFFRPTLLGALDLTSAQLGDAFAVYGIAAMLAYLPGGLIADRVAPRRLLTLSLLATAAGGLWLARIPTLLELYALYAWWGVTTILLFWAALIKATRAVGGDDAQGRTFGILDAGRGLAAAAFASLAVVVLARYLPADVAAAAPARRVEAIRAVILFYTAATAGAAALVWLCVPDSDDDTRRCQPRAHASGWWRPIRNVLRQPAVLLQALIVVCAYCGYKALDNYGLYAIDVLGMSEVDASRFVTTGAYLRPVGAIAAGILADRFGTSRVIGALFALLALAWTLLAGAGADAAGAWLSYANLAVSFVAVFALRGVYFALLQESGVAAATTGTAVGLVSVIGFAPDVFFYPLAGRLLDAAPGAAGFVDYFTLLAGISTLGLLAALTLRWYVSRRRRNAAPP